MYLRVCLTSAACLHTSGLRSPEFKRGSELQLRVHHYLIVTDGKEAEEALCYTGIFVAPIRITITTFHLWQAMALIPDGC